MTSLKKTIIIRKDFRLIDFHTFEEEEKDEKNETNTTTKSKSYFKKDSLRFMIQMFGINEKGESCSITIDDYQPFFYIRVGDHWTESEMYELLAEIKDHLKKRFEDSIVSANLVDYNKLYGFSAGKTSKFVKLVFKNTTTMNRTKNLWYSYNNNGNGSDEYRRRKDFVFRGTKLELYESNIPPLLRYFHINNISPSGWISIPSNRVKQPEEKTTTCDYEYICSLSQVKPLPEKETIVPYKICSFDIEASSSHGDFPLPQKTYKRLVSNIVDTFIKQQPMIKKSDDNETYKYAKSLLKKTIFAGFGHCTFDDIDLVYPIENPSLEYLKKLVHIVCEKTIDSAKKETKEDNSYLLGINKIFERMRQDQENSRFGGGGGDGDVSGEGGEMEEAENDHTDVIDDVVEVCDNIYEKPSSSSKVKNVTVIDVLLNPEYSRDEKITIMDELFTCLFPKLEGDKVTFIGSTFMRYGEKDTYLNHCITVGDCDDVEGAVIECVEDETDLLLRWTELIQEENPDIIIGYNIFGFDYEFMFRRALENHCESEFLLLSKKIGELSGKYKNNVDGYEELTIEHSKMSIASGEYDLRYFKMTGRLQIDMYAYFRRDFNLSSYKLDDVSSQFISDDVKRFEHVNHPKYGNVTELYSQNLTGLHKGDYIHIEMTSFTSDYYKNGKKFQVLDLEWGRVFEGKTYNIVIIDGHEDFDKNKYIKWGMAKDDVTPQDIFRLGSGTPSERAVVAKYCIQDCNLVHHLMTKIDVITGYVEMAKICSVPISYLVFRGQGIKLTSYVAKKCREKNTLMPDLEKVGNADGYEGAIVLPPKCSMYMDNPVACVDYSSLYPSSMISQNLSHDSKVWTKEYNLEGKLVRETGEKDKDGNFVYDNLPGEHYIDLEFDTYRYIRPTPTSRAIKTKCGKMICRWAQGKKGIMPSILEELLKARSDTRKMIKTEKDPFMQNILDKRQLGYKVTANSLYGQCGSRTSTFYEKDVAASTTATGRMMITYARRIIEEVYGDRVYDTECYGPVVTKAEYVYGDSVANYTPVYVRVGGIFDICTIESLAEKYGNGNWVQCIEEGKQDKEFCELTGVESWTEKGWTPLYRVIRHFLAPHKKMFRILTNTGLVDVTDDHSLLRADGTEISPKDMVVGTQLLHYRIGECAVLTKTRYPPIVVNDSDIYSIHVDNMMDAAIYVNYLNYIGYKNYYIKSGEDLSIRVHVAMKPSSTTIITKIHQIDYKGYVYDLTTENHHFAAGVGNMIVHNTDSVFFTFNLQNHVTGEKIRGKDALAITIEIAQDAAKLCTQWLKSPMELSYEKTLMPFILLSKKRYVGMLYETDPNKGKMKFMGLSIKRRDSCDYLKDVYGGILNILMKEKDENIKKAIEFLNQSLVDLVEGKVSMDKLTITKALRSDYKNPNQIGHKILADRIGDRDPGNKPKAGDRIRFVFIHNSNHKALMGEKIETPEFILQNKLKIDYSHYITNQLMKPLQQLFGLALEQIWEYQNKHSLIKKYKSDMLSLSKEFPDIEIFMKKKEKYCSAKIKTLLFDKILTRIQNERNNIREITSFFSKNI